MQKDDKLVCLRLLENGQAQLFALAVESGCLGDCARKCGKIQWVMSRDQAL